MSSSNETGVYGLSDKKILEKWKADLHGQIFARELSDEVEQSLLDTALKQLHEDRDRLDIEAKADGHPEKLSCLVNSGEMEIIAYRLHHPLKTSMTTGIWAGITLGYDIFGETAINVGSYTCLDGFKDRLQEVLVNDVLSKCITEGPINGFNKDNHFREDLTNSIREKSLPGFEASASSIIDALISASAKIMTSNNNTADSSEPTRAPSVVTDIWEDYFSAKPTLNAKRVLDKLEAQDFAEEANNYPGSRLSRVDPMHQVVSSPVTSKSEAESDSEIATHTSAANYSGILPESEQAAQSNNSPNETQKKANVDGLNNLHNYIMGDPSETNKIRSPGDPQAGTTMNESNEQSKDRCCNIF
ncbi:MAG: hypothetical protein TREMPRED_000177 [Tremellales sp. Tagirdzhanova-0007]|nr:MAG: hypothetical protein TREMPRED_000177 [Tremellales sp. Tagirdzhanova-0007]